MRNALLTIATVATLAAALLCAFFVWPTRYRYERITQGGNTTTIREDRFSDATWLLTPAGWIAHRATTAEKSEPLPQDTLASITGQCSLMSYSGDVSCDISNSTDFALSSVTVSFQPKGKTACWADLKGSVEPHTAGKMRVAPPCVNDLRGPDWSWNIIRASGTKPTEN
jgi:hypothetical protein